MTRLAVLTVLTSLLIACAPVAVTPGPSSAAIRSSPGGNWSVSFGGSYSADLGATPAATPGRTPRQPAELSSEEVQRLARSMERAILGRLAPDEERPQNWPGGTRFGVAQSGEDVPLELTSSVETIIRIMVRCEPGCGATLRATNGLTEVSWDLGEILPGRPDALSQEFALPDDRPVYVWIRFRNCPDNRCQYMVQTLWPR
ncbi:hypothetical protein [Deinococcus sp. RM]|uniref:hypothetical protein n=1 Tax=Deinococcus sp. RM TaxID=2316359 RepID=UPI000E686456|nr:hypothetical protein [Deinococcus sp. RM]RIY02260.1 hypothetical protein D3W47_14840 [Deinococcus sp. RM]